MIPFHNITSTAVYSEGCFNLIRLEEGLVLSAYRDTRGIPTIGYGFNLRDEILQPLVLGELGFGVNPDSDLLVTQEERAREQSYLDQLRTLIDQNWSSNEALSTALDNVMAVRALDPVLNVLGNREPDFRFNSSTDPRIRQIFDVAVEEYERRVERWLGGIPPSSERQVLVSLAWNGLIEVGYSPALRKAILSGNRAEAWYEIRYRSNPTGEHTARRYREAQLFGLYDGEFVDLTEGKEVLQMYTAHRAQIEAYELRFPPGALGSAASQLGSARTPVIAAYGLGRTSFVDVLVGKDDSPAITGSVGADLIVGEGGNDHISGLSGGDVLYGGWGDDDLLGGLGDDVLIGEVGNDYYLYFDGEGVDTIIDSDGRGSVVYGGTVLTGGERVEEFPNIYFSDDGLFSYEWAGGDLTINDSIVVEAFQNGDLGIVLRTSDGEPDDNAGAGGTAKENNPSPNDPENPTPRSGSDGPLGRHKAPLSGVESPFDAAGFLVSPIVLDLDGDGVETTPVVAQAQFDHNADGFAERTGWAGSDDGILVWDRDGNGRIDSGRELFGSQTLLSDESLAPHGFAALAELDTNTDGKIDQQDAAWGELRVWRDVNGNGYTAASELSTLESAGVAAINVTFSESSYIDANGHEHRQVGSFIRSDGSTADATDVWFKVDTMRSEAKDHVDVTSAIAALPEIRGYGTLYSLHQAMARDSSGQIAQLVQSFGTQTTIADRNATVEELLLTWANAEGISPTARGGYVDARHVAVLERFVGKTWQYAWQEPGANGTIDEAAANELAQAYVSLAEYVHAELMSQTHLRAYFEDLRFTWDGALRGTLIDSSQAEVRLGALTTQDPDLGAETRQEFERAVKSLLAYRAGTTTADTIVGGIEDDAIDGKGGDDTLYGGLGGDLLDGGDGNDVLRGDEGDDRIASRLGDDWSFGGAGNDLIDSGDGDDIAVGEDGADTLRGGDGADLLFGGAGDDVLDGGAGNDLLTGGDHSHTWQGVPVYVPLNGLGNDTYLFGRGSGQDTINDLDATAGNVDRIVLGPDVLPEDVTLRLSGGLLLSINGTTDTLTVEGWNEGAAGQIERIEFANGTVWDQSYLSTLAYTGTEGDDVIIASPDADKINGLDGNDALYGIAGDDLIDGGDGNDGIQAGDGDDTVYGGEGADELRGEGGADTLNGGEGNDLVYGSYESDTLNGDGGDDLLWGEEDADELNGGDGIDILAGGAGDDVLDGGDGADNLFGGAGDDVLDGGAGNDALTGGDHSHTFWGVPVYLPLNGLGNDTYLFGRGSGQDTVSDIDATAGNVDRIVLGADVLPEDVTLRLAGGLILSINGTTDTLTVESWNEGAAGQIERIEFANGTVWDQSYLATLAYTGTEGDDVIDASPDADTIYGLGGSDGLLGRAGDDVIYAGPGNDSVAAGEGDDTVFGGEGADQLDGAEGDDFLDGGEGDDELYGHGGADTLSGGDGNDKLLAAEGSDTLNGDDGADILAASEGEDVLNGGDGDDLLYGGAGDDVLDGGAGNDYLTGGDYATDWRGVPAWVAASANGLGNDTYLFGRGSGQDTVSDIDATAGNVDRIVLGPDVLPEDVTLRLAGGLILSINGTTDTLTVESWNQGAAGQIERIEFANGTVWDQGYLSSLAYTGTEGHDFIDASPEADTIYGLDGNDGIYGRDGDDLIDSGAGNDGVQAGEGDDTVLGGEGADELRGEAGDDSLRGGDGADILVAGAGDDVLEGGEGTDRLFGGEGDDVLDGGAGNDVLTGGDYTYAWQGALVYVPLNGLGNDTYLFGRGSGQDTVSDIDATAGNEDVAQFLSGIATDQIWFQQSGNNLVVSIIGTADSFTVEDWYSSADQRLERFDTAGGDVLLEGQVQNLVDAMAAFTPPAPGEYTLPPAYANQLDAVIAANWQ